MDEEVSRTAEVAALKKELTAAKKEGGRPSGQTSVAETDQEAVGTAFSREERDDLVLSTRDCASRISADRLNGLRARGAVSTRP